MPHDTVVGIFHLHLTMYDLAQRYHAIEAFTARNFQSSMVVVVGVKLKSGFRDKLAFKTDYPHVALFVFQFWNNPVHFSFGNKTYQRRFKGGGFEIDKMFQFTLHTDYQLFKIMLMGFIRLRIYFDSFRFVQPIYFEKLIHKLKVTNLSRR